MKSILTAVLFVTIVACTNNAADSKPNDVDHTSNGDTANKKTSMDPTDSMYTSSDSTRNR